MQLVIGLAVLAAIFVVVLLRRHRARDDATVLSEFEYTCAAAEFADKVLTRSHETPVLVDFFATWCAPCRVFTPVLAELAREYRGRFLLVKIDVDRNKALAEQYEIYTMPTVLLFQDGISVERFSGARLANQVKDALSQHGIFEPIAISG